jgi:hypothetical protein
MMKTSERSILAGLVPAAMLLASCASSDGGANETVSEDGSTVPVVEVVFDVDPADGQWNLVGVGDSFLGWTTVAERYAGLLEGDLDVEITVEKIVNSTSNRLEYLRNDTASQDLLAEAEIVLVEPQPGVPAAAAWSPYLAGNCCGDDGLECFRTAQADFELYVGELFDELIALTPDKTTIVATLVGTWGGDAFNPTLLEDDPETHRIFVEHIVALQGISATAAAERGIGSVDVSVAFSGLDYDEPVPDGYLEIDDTHLTDEGSRVVAELLHGLSTT